MLSIDSIGYPYPPASRVVMRGATTFTGLPLLSKNRPVNLNEFIPFAASPLVTTYVTTM